MVCSHSVPSMSFAQLPDQLAARAASFSVVGAVNGMVGIAVIVMAGVFGTGPMLANVLGYGVGLVVSFTLNSRVTFRRRVVNRTAAMRFLGAFVVAFAVNLAVVKVVTDLSGARKLLASLAGTPFYVAIFYLFCEYWVFRRPHAPD